MARFSMLTRAMIEEMSAELADRDEATLQHFMERIGEVIAWIGHGDVQRLPVEMQNLVEQRPELEQAST